MRAASAEATGSARLFIALWPDPCVRDAIAAWSERWQWNAVARRVRTERLHLTLHFLGNVPRERLPDLRRALETSFAPFSLVLDRSAIWPGGVAVLEPGDVPRPLRQLHTALADALQRVALAPETRAFRPHVTLARRAGPALPPAAGQRLRWPVKDYTLVESRSQPAAGYVVIQAYP